MKIVEGEEEISTGALTGDTADIVRGDGWIAARRGGGHVLEYDAGEIQSRDIALDITADEFARLRADHGTFDAIRHAHGG